MMITTVFSFKIKNLKGRGDVVFNGGGGNGFPLGSNVQVSLRVAPVECA